jgi:uncharacterized FAD-dependent dehydrogenase
VRGAPPVVVVGAGPAGLFAALALIERASGRSCSSVAPTRGRRHAVARIARAGIVDPESNYCFGEGGAGTFSDGKLYTRATKRGRSAPCSRSSSVTAHRPTSSSTRIRTSGRTGSRR